jgi:hypothetical protein
MLRQYSLQETINGREYTVGIIEEAIYRRQYIGDNIWGI